MLDVHAPHEVLHTWKGFFIHIATIVVGLFIAVALEQSVEALHRRHEVAALREDLHAESRQIVADARGSEASHLYEIRWLTRRIAQTQVAIRERQPIGPREPNECRTTFPLTFRFGGQPRPQVELRSSGKAR
jgi:hypothetical protein